VEGVAFSLPSACAAALSRLASLAIVARLQPVATCIELQDWAALIMRLIPALRSASAGQPLASLSLCLGPALCLAPAAGLTAFTELER
jgi:hypothetical protein